MPKRLMVDWAPQIGSDEGESDCQLLGVFVDEVSDEWGEVWLFLEIFDELMGLGHLPC